MKEKRTWPWVTGLYAAGMIYTYVWTRKVISMGLGELLYMDYAFSWISFTENPFHEWPKLISHLFIHSDMIHLVSNLIFFLLFAFRLEKRAGSIYFIFGLLVFGCGGALLQGVITPFQNGLVGSSALVTGCAGAFFVLYPQKFPVGSGRKGLIKKLARIPVFVILFIWFLIELLFGLHFFSTQPDGRGGLIQIAHWAHVAGFILGGIWALPLIYKEQR